MDTKVAYTRKAPRVELVHLKSISLKFCTSSMLGKLRRETGGFTGKHMAIQAAVAGVLARCARGVDVLSVLSGTGQEGGVATT